MSKLSFAIVYAVFVYIVTKVTDRLAMFVRNTSDFESNIVAVERIGEYTELPPEVCSDS